MSASKRPNLDTVTTINRDGSRFAIHPADVFGRFTVLRRLVALLLIAVYGLLPWIPVNGNPAVFLDIMNRRFHLFGLTLATQDLWLLVFLISGLAFTLFYVTAFLGRVWCGWACPQTVFLEHVYRRVERWIDGDAPNRRKLDKAFWSPGKIVRRLLKHAIFIVFSALIAHVFLAYFVSIPELWSWMRQSPFEHWSSFLFVGIITLTLYANFAWFREQLCIVICPYGRMQSALVDEHTLNIAYDYQRGEPPGPVSDPNAGDCIDCRRCVQVCPTGIDIRQGLQLECVGCANCIDACDQIMDRVNRPRGLIRYASEEELEGRRTRWLRPRAYLYTGLLLLGISVAGFAFSTVKPISAQVTRMTGSAFYISEDSIRNQYRVNLLNKSTQAQTFRIEPVVAAEWADAVVVERQSWELGPSEERSVTWVVRVPLETYTGGFPLEIQVTAEPGGWQVKRELNFVGPDPSLLQQ
ncbi:MAG: cytochrome c oxidase accessory protein CcoG [Opitutales bacterium]|nr:cytochrome c oxidase accessory protein CcoG [Opitutales bacterium]